MILNFKMRQINKKVLRFLLFIIILFICNNILLILISFSESFSISTFTFIILFIIDVIILFSIHIFFEIINFLDFKPNSQKTLI